MDFNKIPTKRIVLLLLVLALVLFTGYGMLYAVIVPAEFMSIVTLVVGFYFGYANGKKNGDNND